MKFSDSEWSLATANKIQRQRMKFSDNEWIQRQRMEFSDSELKFSDSEFSLATANQIQRILKQMDDHKLKLLINDEISMVSNNRLLHIHQRLKEIFGTSSSKIFAGVSIIAVGDLHQLPPTQQKSIFCRYSNDVYHIHGTNSRRQKWLKS